MAADPLEVVHEGLDDPGLGVDATILQLPHLAVAGRVQRLRKVEQPVVHADPAGALLAEHERRPGPRLLVRRVRERIEVGWVVRRPPEIDERADGVVGLEA